jgi:hypothetical protein
MEPPAISLSHLLSLLPHDVRSSAPHFLGFAQNRPQAAVDAPESTASSMPRSCTHTARPVPPRSSCSPIAGARPEPRHPLECQAAGVDPMRCLHRAHAVWLRRPTVHRSHSALVVDAGFVSPHKVELCFPHISYSLSVYTSHLRRSVPWQGTALPLHARGCAATHPWSRLPARTRARCVSWCHVVSSPGSMLLCSRLEPRCRLIARMHRHGRSFFVW